MNAMIAVVIVVLPHYVRITRAAVITEAAKDYVTAARASGATRLRLMFAEVLPNCAAPLIVQASLGVSTAILDAAALGFLGLGAQPPRVRMGDDARRCARIRASRMVGRDVPRSHDPAHRARVQPAGRRLARRPRPETEAVMALLEIEDLHVEFPTQAGLMRAVEGVSLSLDEGEVLGIVGESGSGKSVSMLALMGLVAYPGRVRAKRLSFAGQDLLSLSDRARRKVIGGEVAMIFQEPTTSLNPCFTIGFQLAETLELHLDMDRKAARNRSIELLDLVGIPAPASRLNDFPHQMSGGMNQRVMIAMAIACNPDFSSPTSRRPPSTSPSRPRSSTSCASCSRSAAWRSCSSPTTWASSPRWRAASPSCTRDR
jgi:predicted ABC-type transport system involved in lysophospholipase L1 biosynthesis ATPase subunit